ncbi:MAG TPA: hypothetical protein DCS07_00400, partial [Bdellovibrionales bacterium]|nr:hypothetical protein [Bdellovibrionales bacterium]
MSSPKGAGQLGVIFDMDGVLVDSTEAHFKAFKTFGARRGIPFTMEFFRTIFGLHNRAIFPLWLGDSLTPQQIDDYAFEKESLYRELAPELVKPLPGVVHLMKTLHAAGFRLAIGSSGPRANVEVAQDILGCRELFSSTVSGDDVVHGKPNPEIFIKAASQLGLEASACVVFEDALAGV